MHFRADYEPAVSTESPSSPAQAVYRSEADPHEEQKGIGWSPPRFMSRELSRITLEVTEVRVERLQAISDDAALCEGVEGYAIRDVDINCDSSGAWPATTGCVTTSTARCTSPSMRWYPGRPRACFRDLWDSLNAKRGAGWDVNPWVWVVRFSRLPTILGVSA